MNDTKTSRSIAESRKLIFIHGMESAGTGAKANLLRSRIPEILTPTFYTYEPGMPYQELLAKRMAQLNTILETKVPWTLIGSSFGGLMATLYASHHPQKIEKMILLAPFLNVPEAAPQNLPSTPLKIPVIVFHSRKDQVVPLKIVKPRAEQLFSDLTYHIVEDDIHRLQKTAERLDWKALLQL